MFVSREMIGAGADGKRDAGRDAPASRHCGRHGRGGPGCGARPAVRSGRLRARTDAYFLYGPIGRTTRP